MLEGVKELTDQFADFFWGVGYFGWQIATVYALFVAYKVDISYSLLFLGLFLFSGWLNHKVLKKFIFDLRPNNYILFLQSEKVRKNTNGMPSGHAQQTAFALTIAYLITNKYLYQSIALLVLTLLQRYVYRNHTFYQLLAGTILGVILGYVSYYVMNFLERRIKKIEKGVNHLP
jgi:membrane-associated phospholipid phosphatase